MFFVVHGYCGPDHFTAANGAVLELSEFKTAEAVEEIYEKWKEDIEGNSEASDLTFRVIEGSERKLVPVEKVTKHKLR
jgi:hypothetical protein